MVSPAALMPTLLDMVHAHRDAGAVAAFDWDDTVMQGDAGLAVMAARDQAEGTHTVQTYETLLARGGKELAYPYATTTHQGWTDTDLRQLAATAIQAAVTAGTLVERPWVRELMDAMNEAGWEVWVISASPKSVIDTAAARIGIASERVIAMQMHTNAQGSFVPLLRQPAPYLTGKVPAIQAVARGPITFAASDSPADTALLTLAQHALAVHCRDDGLAELAAERGWWTVEDRR